MTYVGISIFLRFDIFFWEIHFSQFVQLSPTSSHLSSPCSSQWAGPWRIWGRRGSWSSCRCTWRRHQPPWTSCSSRGRRWPGGGGRPGHRDLGRRGGAGFEHLALLQVHLLRVRQLLPTPCQSSCQLVFETCCSSSWSSSLDRWGGPSWFPAIQKRTIVTELEVGVERMIPRPVPPCNFPQSTSPPPFSTRNPQAWRSFCFLVFHWFDFSAGLGLVNVLMMICF